MKQFVSAFGALTLGVCALPSAAAAQVTFTGSYAPATLPAGGGASATVLTLSNNSGVGLTGGSYTYVYPTNLNYNSAGFSGCGAIDTTGTSLTQLQVSNINLVNGASCAITVSGTVTVSGTYGLRPTNVTYAGAAGSPLALTGGANPTLVVAAPPVPVPTMSEWAIMLLAAMLAGLAALQVHRRRAA